MSPKWAKKAHFDDISYKVFNRRKSSYFIIKPLDFTISCRMNHFTESNHQKLIFFLSFLIIYKIPSVRFRCYRVYHDSSRKRRGTIYEQLPGNHNNQHRGRNLHKFTQVRDIMKSLGNKKISISDLYYKKCHQNGPFWPILVTFLIMSLIEEFL